MSHKIILILLLVTPLYLSGQGDLFGNWEGKMSSVHGKYFFNLVIQPDQDRRKIRGFATHDRNGSREVIELKGIFYSDNSIYLADVVRPKKKIKAGETFSRLQFAFKWLDGAWVLDGHWQEYFDLRKYRKGRLVLRKRRPRA